MTGRHARVLLPGYHYHTIMATRSTITAKFNDGKHRSIYVHFDGYIDGVGKTLLTHYTDQAKIEALVSLGGLSVLDAECANPDGHSYGSPAKGHSVAYHRDRGEDWESNQPSTGDTAAEALENGPGEQEFNYAWDGQSWSVDGKPLAQAVAEDN